MCYISTLLLLWRLAESKNGEGTSGTYFRWAAFNLRHFSTTATMSLFMVKLKILQTLGQGQFLLDSHTEEGVQGLLLILCCCKLPLHLIQLRDILIASTQRQRLRKTLFNQDLLLVLDMSVCTS